MSASFVHLHLHTEYSTLDGLCRIEEVVAKAKQLGMPAVAMTDHGNVFGAIEFYKVATREGINPILGCEIYLAPREKSYKQQIPNRKNACHLTLLAENNIGWANLQKLVTEGHLGEGVYYGKPRVDYDDLEKYSEGIICLSGCITGPVNEWLLLNEEEKAKETLQRLVRIYGENQVYVEIHDHGLEMQKKVLPSLIRLARECQVPLCAANDVHFLDREDHDAHDVMICIGTGRLQVDLDRMRYSPEVYFKSAEEMRSLFKECPEACDNTLEIAKRCQVSMTLDPTSSEKYPQFEAPDGSPREEYLRKVCYQGLEERYGKKQAQDPGLKERLDYEIQTINDLGFASYFLITADFIQWARDQEIPVGPGRGSAAGSLVAYTMGITDVCPMRFGLLFERFLNPERVSPPDVDIDFCQSRRSEVIDYVRKKYGERCVSHIITYGTLGAKSVIRDVARVMGISYGEADSLAKKIETKPGVKLKEEYDANQELKELIDSSSTYQDLWNYALKLEGLTRNTGVHAAGVVIGDRELDEHCALAKGKEGEIVTQLDMGAITDVGLLKMDFLGLKNLTVIQEASSHIRKYQPSFDVLNIPLDDEATFALLDRGETMGVFQLESGGMVETCRKYGIKKIEDIIDLLALYRPGAMQFIDEMIEVKEGRRKVQYEHPLLEEVCGDTYGVMIYQEQVQNAAKLLAGYTLGGADVLRRAMGKKKPSEMAKQREIFVEGAKTVNGIEKDVANKVFDKIASFAGYGFNKSHSACYGHISYWTAYLKANFPVEFMAALLSNEIKNTDKIGVFVNECHRMGIEILPPDINKSRLLFAPEKIGKNAGAYAIRYGLAAIKNVGGAAMEKAIAEREQQGMFTSMEDFSNRLDTKVINKKILENLVKAGAFDSFEQTRAVLYSRVESVVASASSTQRDRLAGQASLFDVSEMSAGDGGRGVGGQEKGIELEDQESGEEWTLERRLEHEKELLGFYVTGHPLDQFRGVVDSSRYLSLGLLEELDCSNPRSRFPFAGRIRQIEHKMTKSGKPFGVLVLEDFTGSAELLCWAESYVPARDAGLLTEGKVISLKAAIMRDDRTETRKLVGSGLKEVKPTRFKKGKKKHIELVLWLARHQTRDLEKIAMILSKYPGKKPVLIHFQNGAGQRVTLQVGEKFHVQMKQELLQELRPWL